MTTTILSAVYGYVCFQVDSGPECVAGVDDLLEAKTLAIITDRVRVDGDWLDESDVDLLLDVAARSQVSTSPLEGTSA